MQRWSLRESRIQQLRTIVGVHTHTPDDIYWAIAAGSRQFLARRIRRSICLGPLLGRDLNIYYSTNYNFCLRDRWAVVIERAQSLYESPYAILLCGAADLVLCTNPIHNKTGNDTLSRHWSGRFATWWAVSYVVPELWDLLIAKITHSQNTYPGELATCTTSYF